MIRICDIVNAKKLDGITVIAGAGGINREVRTVTLLDAPDAPQWLKGNELILSSAYFFKQDSVLFMAHLTQMYDLGSSGLGIKMGRFIGNLPPEVESFANKHDFPILKIPFDLVWTDVISTFYKLLYELEQPLPAIHSNPENIALLMEALKWNSSRFVERFTELFKIPVIIVDNNGSINAENSVPGVEALKDLLKNRDFFAGSATAEIYERKGLYISTYPVPMIRPGKNEYLVYGVTAKENIKEMAYLFELMERLASVKMEPVWDEEQRYRYFLMRVVSGKVTADEIRSFERNRGVPGLVYSGIMLITGSNYQEIFDSIREFAKTMHSGKSAALPPRLLYNQSAGEAVVLFEYQSDKPRPEISSLLDDIAAEISDDIIAKGGGCLAISKMRPSLDGISICVKEAEQAREIGRLLWKHHCKYSYVYLSAYIALQTVERPHIDFSDIELLKSPNALSFDGADTTEVYLECNNYKLAAKRLFIHENTLRYRINKISELLNQNLEDPYVSHNILMKIKLLKLYGKKL